MNKLFENWNRYLKEEALPIDSPNPFEDLVSRFNTLTDPEERQLPFYADIQAGQGVDSPYVYIIDHRHDDRVIARFRTPESFQSGLEQAIAAAEREMDRTGDLADYSTEFGYELEALGDE